MDERQLVCYPRSSTCSLRISVCYFLKPFFSSNPPIITNKISSPKTLYDSWIIFGIWVQEKEILYQGATIWFREREAEKNDLLANLFLSLKLRLPALS